MSAPAAACVLGALALLIALDGAAYDPAGTPDDWPSPMPHMHYGMLLGDRLETRFADGADAYVWDVQGWYGSGRQRAWMKSEGASDWVIARTAARSANS